MKTLAKASHRHHGYYCWTLSVSIEWKLEDLWIGVFWKRLSRERIRDTGVDVWVCLVPCLPIHVAFLRDYL